MVVGLAVPGDHGHGAMVMPGPPHASGGYDVGGGAIRRSMVLPGA